jgi:hypothetical protein
MARRAPLRIAWKGLTEQSPIRSYRCTATM